MKKKFCPSKYHVCMNNVTKSKRILDVQNTFEGAFWSSANDAYLQKKTLDESLHNRSISRFIY